MIEDLEGSEHPDTEAAVAEAKAAAREMTADRLRHAKPLGDRSIDITDAEGSAVATVRFRDALGSG